MGLFSKSKKQAAPEPVRRGQVMKLMQVSAIQAVATAISRLAGAVEDLLH
jgi:hypothetical protein